MILFIFFINVQLTKINIFGVLWPLNISRVFLLAIKTFTLADGFQGLLFVKVSVTKAVFSLTARVNLKNWVSIERYIYALSFVLSLNSFFYINFNIVTLVRRLKALRDISDMFSTQKHIRHVQAFLLSMPNKRWKLGGYF